MCLCIHHHLSRREGHWSAGSLKEEMIASHSRYENRVVVLRVESLSRENVWGVGEMREGGLTKTKDV